jgi:hypothetical protein
MSCERKVGVVMSRRSERQAAQSVRPVSGWIRAVPILSAVLVGVASFTLSFFAQSEVSAALGAVPARLSWLVPIIIDGGVLAGSASLWSSSTRGARQDPVAYFTIVALLALSVVVNVHHAASDGGLLGSVIAGAPPVVLLLCLELVASQARREAREAFAANAAVTTTLEQPAPAPVEVPVTVAPEAVAPARAPELLAAAVTVTPADDAEPVRGWELTAPRHSVEATATAPAAAVHLEPDTRRPVAALSVAPARLHVVAAVDTDKARESPAALRAVSGLNPPTQADQIRSMFAEHVARGGDGLDSGLARQFAETLGAPVPSVRKVLAGLRKDNATG